MISKAWLIVRFPMIFGFIHMFITLMFMQSKSTNINLYRKISLIYCIIFIAISTIFVKVFVLPITKEFVFTVLPTVFSVLCMIPSINLVEHRHESQNSLLEENTDDWWNSLSEEEKSGIKDHHAATQQR